MRSVLGLTTAQIAGRMDRCGQIIRKHLSGVPTRAAIERERKAMKRARLMEPAPVTPSGDQVLIARRTLTVAGVVYPPGAECAGARQWRNYTALLDARSIMWAPRS